MAKEVTGGVERQHNLLFNTTLFDRNLRSDVMAPSLAALLQL